MEDGIVKVSGSKLLKPKQYTVKLERAAQIACRTIVIGGIRGPITIANIDNIKKGVVEQIEEYYRDIPKSSGLKSMYSKVFFNSSYVTFPFS